MNGLDFHPQGEMIAMIDQGGQLVVSEVDTDKLLFKKEMMTNELASTCKLLNKKATSTSSITSLVQQMQMEPQ